MLDSIAKFSMLQKLCKSFAFVSFCLMNKGIAFEAANDCYRSLNINSFHQRIFDMVSLC